MRILTLRPRRPDADDPAGRELYFCDSGAHDRATPATLAIEAGDHRICLCRACAHDVVRELGAASGAR